MLSQLVIHSKIQISISRFKIRRENPLAFPLITPCNKMKGNGCSFILDTMASQKKSVQH